MTFMCRGKKKGLNFNRKTLLKHASHKAHFTDFLSQYYLLILRKIYFKSLEPLFTLACG